MPIPLILNLRYLARSFIIKNVDFAGDGLFLADDLGHVAGFEVHLDGVAGAGDFVVEALDLFEGGLEAVLWREVRLEGMCE